MSPHPSPSLRCHEEEVFLMDSPMPCSSSISRRVLAAAQGGQEAAEDSTAEDAADAGHQQQQPPRRYYLPFGQNANELSMERKRLHRISLQQHSAQRGEECRQQPQQRTAAIRIAAAHGTAEAVATGGGRAEAAATALGPQETPKNGAKVLGPIDVNIPNNGSRLAQGQQLQQQQHQSSSRSRASRPPRQQPPIGTRKRRAEQQQSSEERLNQKERIWVCADVDRVIHLDGRCLQALLEAEQHVQVDAGQVSRQQQSGDGVEPSARARLVQWLQDVCEEEHADYVVLPLAVAYLDRVLASKFVPRRNLQALGSACLLLASKMKAPQPMVAARLSELTAGNVNAEEMLDWEMVVVNQLQWNLLQATPFEFFDQLLVRSPILEALREDFARCLHSMQKDLCLATQLASVQASACLLFCALRSQRQHLLEESERTIRRHLGLNSVNSLAPLFGNIATAIGGHAASVAVCAKKLNGCSEKQQQQTIHPPSSKRMSLQQSPPVTSDFLSAFGVVDDEVSADGIIASTANEPSTSASSGVPSAASTTRPASNSPPIQQPDEESSRSSTNSSSNESTKPMKLVNDSGYRSSEPASPPVPKPADLLDRNRSDFGPLF